MTSELLAPIPRLSLRHDEAAQALSVSPRTLHEWRKQPNGPPCAVIGSVVLYPVRELAEWLTSQTSRGTQG